MPDDRAARLKNRDMTDQSIQAEQPAIHGIAAWADWYLRMGVLDCIDETGCDRLATLSGSGRAGVESSGSGFDGAGRAGIGLAISGMASRS